MRETAKPMMHRHHAITSMNANRGRPCINPHVSNMIPAVNAPAALAPSSML